VLRDLEKRDGEQETENREQRTENREQRTENREQRTENGKRRATARRQSFPAALFLSAVSRPFGASQNLSDLE
jgi:hypothetical protein